jgi:outer membrane protein OmpA-like peptidoglycan-associated protein
MTPGWRNRNMKQKIALCVFFTIISLNAGAGTFTYKHLAGDKYRIISTVFEDVYINTKISHRAEIVNRIAVDVISVDNGEGMHKAVFLTAEKALGAGAGKGFQWSRDYESIFTRSPQGRITIDSKYYMPVVRNVPVFPAKDLKPGETWTAEGHEMHDFRDSFGIQEPYRIPFTANYTFLGNLEWKGKQYPAFSVSYRIFAEVPAVRGRVWPRRILGASDQTVFWDPVLGQAAAYKEDFRMIFSLSDGRTVEYRGEARAEILEAPAMDKEKIAVEVLDEIKRLDIPDTGVRVTDEGVAISLENIQFQPDSAILLPGEKRKLDKIAEILLKYPDRDILVGGHTALAGTGEARAKLSAERAAAVADYLLGKNVRSADRVIVRGYGAEQPLADNSSEAGRRRNRRVEVTILEN